MGVPYDTFWHLNPSKLKPIEKAYEMKMESVHNRMNLEAWVNGLYVQNAVSSIFGKNNKYPTKPYDIFGTEKTLTPEEEFEAFKRYAEDFAMRKKATEAMG